MYCKIFFAISAHTITFFFLFFRLGNDRYKTKPIYETLNPKWLEQFDLDLIEGGSQELEISIWDKDKGKNYCLCTNKFDFFKSNFPQGIPTPSE